MASLSAIHHRVFPRVSLTEIVFCLQPHLPVEKSDKEGAAMGTHGYAGRGEARYGSLHTKTITLDN